MVADQLGFLYVDNEIVAQAAARAGVGPPEVADAERRRSLIMRALDAIAQGGGETWTMSTVGLPPTGSQLGRYDLLALIRESDLAAARRCRSWKKRPQRATIVTPSEEGTRRECKCSGK